LWWGASESRHFLFNQWRRTSGCWCGSSHRREWPATAGICRQRSRRNEERDEKRMRRCSMLCGWLCSNFSLGLNKIWLKSVPKFVFALDLLTYSYAS
jgi:hypothetical protein